MKKWQKKVEEEQLKQYNCIDHPYKITVLLEIDNWIEAKKWLKDNIKKKNYLIPIIDVYDNYQIHIKDPYTGIGVTHVHKIIRFRFKSEAMAFKLVWKSE